MTHKNTIRTVAAALASVMAAGVLPAVANAQGWRDEAARRQHSKNEWRNLAIAAGGVTALGLLRHDPTLGFLGGAGALYSLNRYEQDRKSQDKAARVRSSFFSKPYFYRNGVQYDRKTVSNNGQRYYRFVRH